MMLDLAYRSKGAMGRRLSDSSSDAPAIVMATAEWVSRGRMVYPTWNEGQAGLKHSIAPCSFDSLTVPSLPFLHPFASLVCSKQKTQVWEERNSFVIPITAYRRC